MEDATNKANRYVGKPPKKFTGKLLSCESCGNLLQSTLMTLHLPHCKGQGTL